MARDFDGIDDTIAEGSVALTVRDNWTLSAFINPETLPTTGTGTAVFDMAVYNGKDGGGGPNNGYGFGVGGDNGTAGSKLIGLFGGIAWKNTTYTFAAADTWYQVVMTRNAGTLRFYVDGVDVGYSDTGADNGVPTLNFTIGCQDRAAEGVIWFFDGRIAEVGAWDRALSASEILGLGKGYSPLFFLRNLQRYYSLIGRNSPETDTKTGKTATVTGAVQFAHPRIIYPSPAQIRRFGSAAAPPASGRSAHWRTLMGVGF